ncbi:MAG TPA: DUF3054 domain-containing protein [Nocardioides sp.]|nr:DUF3054 domain-containing protein [Nocardioides sp.]
MKWLGLDVVLVLLFAAIGRLSHDEGLALRGWAHTAWPFLAGTVLGWLVVRLRGRDPRTLASGVVIWLCTVLGGMVLRQLSDQGTALPFVVVALVVLAVFLLLPRLLVPRLLSRRQG